MLLRTVVWYVRETVLDILFPRSCVGCGTDDVWLCEACDATVAVPTMLTCFECGRPSADGCFCSECAPKRAVRGIWCVARYGVPALREAIHTVKYQSAHAMIQILARWMRRFSERWPFLFAAPACFVPVPLHPTRERERGFNQAHVLAASWLAMTNAGTCGCWLLARPRATTSQVHLKREQRITNVVGAFTYVGPTHMIPSQRIVLVDDVSTTGATLEQCGRVLQECGFLNVWGFVLAKG